MLNQQSATKTEVFVLIIVALVLHDLLFWGYSLSGQNRIVPSTGDLSKPSAETFPPGVPPASVSETLPKNGQAPPKNDSIPASVLEDFGPAPEVTLYDLSSQPVSLSALKGKTVLVDFWGTWCKSCCDEMPDMNKVYLRHKDKGFELIAIAVEFDRSVEKRFQKVKKKVTEMGVSFTIVFGDDSVVKAFGGKVENFPQTYLIDRNGKIRKKIVGARKEEFWENLVQTALSLKD